MRVPGAVERGVPPRCGLVRLPQRPPLAEEVAEKEQLPTRARRCRRSDGGGQDRLSGYRGVVAGIAGGPGAGGAHGADPHLVGGQPAPAGGLHGRACRADRQCVHRPRFGEACWARPRDHYTCRSPPDLTIRRSRRFACQRALRNASFRTGHRPPHVGGHVCCAVGRGQSGRACAEPPSRPSAPRSGGGAQRRALTAVSTRARCRLRRRRPTTTSCGRRRARNPRIPALANSSPLEVIRLRGGVASRTTTDPSQPAVLLCTLPMYGSRLLFRGYGSNQRLRVVDAAMEPTARSYWTRPIWHRI